MWGEVSEDGGKTWTRFPQENFFLVPYGEDMGCAFQAEDREPRLYRVCGLCGRRDSAPLGSLPSAGAGERGSGRQPRRRRDARAGSPRTDSAGGAGRPGRSRRNGGNHHTAGKTAKPPGAGLRSRRSRRACPPLPRRLPPRMQNLLSLLLLPGEQEPAVAAYPPEPAQLFDETVSRVPEEGETGALLAPESASSPSESSPQTAAEAPAANAPADQASSGPAVSAPESPEQAFPGGAGSARAGRGGRLCRCGRGRGGCSLCTEEIALAGAPFR